jgi:hypothetical protein
MPKFEIELTDGRRFEVDADSQEAALAGVHQQFGGADLGKKTPDGKGIVGVAPYADPQQAQQPQQAAPAKPDTSISSGLQNAVAGAVRGTGKTLQHFSPFGETGESLQQTGEGMAPANYQPAKIVNDDYSINASEAPRAVAEAAPQMAAGLLAARTLAKLTPLGRLGSALAGFGGVNALTSLGQRAEDRAAERTGDRSAAPSAADKAIVAGTLAAETVPEALSGMRLIPGAGRLPAVGARGVANAGGRLATTAAVEAGTEGLQSGIEQTGRTIGTEGGIRINPVEAANAAATGGLVGSTFGAKSAAREANRAVKYRDVDVGAAQRVASDMETAADGRNLGDVKVGAQVVSEVEQVYKTALAQDVQAIGRRNLDAETTAILTRIRAGKKISERNIDTLENTLAAHPNGQQVFDHVRALRTLGQLKATGDFSNDRFVGGTSRKLENALWFLKDKPKGALYGGAAMAGYAIPGVMAHAAPFLATGAGLYAGSRLLDSLTGSRSPAQAFVESFGGGNQAAQAPQGPVPPGGNQTPPGAGPSGPQGPWGPVPPQSSYPTRVPNVAQRSTLPAVIPQAQQAEDSTIYAGAPQADPQLTGPRGPSRPMGRAPSAPINMSPEQQLMLPPGNGAISQGGPAPMLALPAPAPANLPDIVRPPAITPRAPRAVSALAKALASRHNAEVQAERNRKPIVDDGAPRPVPKLTAVEEQLGNDVLDAIKKGANTVREVRVAVDPELDTQSLNDTLNRLKVEGKITRDGAGVKLVGQEQVKPAKVPAAVRAQVKAKPVKAAEELPKKAAAVAEAVQTPEPVRSAPTTADLDIPDFLRRTKDNKVPGAKAAENKTPIAAATAEKAAEAPKRLSPHFKGTREESIQSAVDDYLTNGRGRFLSEDLRKASEETTRRIMGAKFDMADAVAKEIPGFDKDSFIDELLYSRSFTYGRQLAERMKAQYPDYADVFDRAFKRPLSEKKFFYTYETNTDDGTGKPKKKSK